MKHSTDGKLIVLIVNFDDIVLIGNHEEEMAHLKLLLSKEFEIKDLKFEMLVARSSEGISISQQRVCSGPPKGK